MTGNINNEMHVLNSREKHMAKKVMNLVNPWTGEMECKVCGSVHFASIKPMSGGKYYRGSWQCRYGCALPERAKIATESVKEVPAM